MRSNSFNDPSTRTEAALRAQLIELRRELARSQQEVEKNQSDLQQRQELLRSAAGDLSTAPIHSHMKPRQTWCSRFRIHPLKWRSRDGCPIKTRLLHASSLLIQHTSMKVVVDYLYRSGARNFIPHSAEFSAQSLIHNLTLGSVMGLTRQKSPPLVIEK